MSDVNIFIDKNKNIYIYYIMIDLVYIAQSVRVLNVPKMKMPLFSNNALVYYKKGSLATGGVGSVRNISAKSKRT